MFPPLPDDVLTILARYRSRIEHSSIRAITSHAGFSGARVWKIETTHGCWAVRRWPAGGLPLQRMRGLHRLLEHLQDHGLNFVSVPIPTDDGDTLPTGPENSTRWQVEPWLPGVADFEKQPTETRLCAAIGALARWHEVAATFTPSDEMRVWFACDPSAPSPALEERLKAARQLTTERLLSLKQAIPHSLQGEPRDLCLEMAASLGRVLPSVLAELTGMQHLKVRLQPCLRDIWHDHVLFTGNEVTGLIDPSACRRESVAADLARLVGSLIEDDPDGWRIALDEYRRRRGLTLEEETLLAVLDRSGVVLSAATWLEWLSTHPRRFDSSEGTLKRLHHWRRRLKCLEQGTSGLASPFNQFLIVPSGRESFSSIHRGSMTNG